MVAWRAITTLVVVVVLGPLVGLAALLMLLGSFGQLSFLQALVLGAMHDLLSLAEAARQLLLGFVALAYWTGGAAALCVGGWIAVRSVFRGNVGYVETVLVALVAGTLTRSVPIGSGWRLEGAFSIEDHHVALCVVSALICRWLLDQFGILPMLKSASATPFSRNLGKS